MNMSIETSKKGDDCDFDVSGRIFPAYSVLRSRGGVVDAMVICVFGSTRGVTSITTVEDRIEKCDIAQGSLDYLYLSNWDLLRDFTFRQDLI